MRAVVQRAEHAKVAVGDTIVGSIDKGLIVYIGVGIEDTKIDADYLAEKIAYLRIFPDSDDKMNLSVVDLDLKILAVSQFTLYGDVRKGKRPSYSNAAAADKANDLYDYFLSKIKSYSVNVESGKFQHHMLVTYTNIGPVTILIDSKKDF